MKKINPIFYFLNLICLIGVIYLLFQNKETERTAYFLSAQVYNEFDYKKELELELQATQNEAKSVIDSLELDMKMTIDYLESIEPTQEQLMRFDKKQQNYLTFRDKVENGYLEKTQEYYDLIWDRINSYVQAYGKENGYTYIFGANGDGSLMYAAEGKDITAEIIAVINQKYAGE